MTLPPWTSAQIALKGIWAAVIDALFLAAIAFGVVQTVRLEGFKFWPLSIEGAKPKAARLETDLANVREAQALAEQEAKRQRIYWQNHYRTLAKETDLANATETQPRADDDLARYAADNRVQPCPYGSARGGTGATPSGGRTGSGDRPGGMSGVDDGRSLRQSLAAGDTIHQADDRLVVSMFSAQVCTTNTARLLDAQAWGLTLERESAAAVSERVED
jgi:hypothetical protein